MSESVDMRPPRKGRCRYSLARTCRRAGTRPARPLFLPPLPEPLRRDAERPVELAGGVLPGDNLGQLHDRVVGVVLAQDRKSTRLNSSHANISYAVFCLKKKKMNN